jgi:hypothetical protein
MAILEPKHTARRQWRWGTSSKMVVEDEQLGNQRREEPVCEGHEESEDHGTDGRGMVKLKSREKR